MNVEGNWNEFQSKTTELAKQVGLTTELADPASDASIFLLSRVNRVFREGGLDGPWFPISRVTAFIREKRASAPTSSRLPLHGKSGRLAGSFVNYVDDKGEQFGVSTNVKYAKVLHEGGKTEPNDVRIGAFTRKNPKGGTSKVKAFTMHMKGGHTIPARPFWPRGQEEMDKLYYQWLLPVEQIFTGHIEKPFQ